MQRESMPVDVLFVGGGPASLAGSIHLMDLIARHNETAKGSSRIEEPMIALIEKGTPVIVIAPEDAVREKTLSNLAEVRARGASIALIHTEGDPMASEADVAIAVPRTAEPLTPLLTVLPLSTKRWYS